MRRSMRALVCTAVVAATLPAGGFAHNAGHVILPSGECVDVGSNKEAPLVPEQNQNRNETPGPDFGRLDLIEGRGDQYGARFAAEQGNSAVAPGGCPA